MRDLTNLTTDELRTAIISDTERLREAVEAGDVEEAHGLQWVLAELRRELAQREAVAL